MLLECFSIGGRFSPLSGNDMNFAILLIDIGVIAFLVWGCVLSLVSIALTGRES
jgi:hypothetical protein